MKQNKIMLLALSLVMLTFTFSACVDDKTENTANNESIEMTNSMQNKETPLPLEIKNNNTAENKRSEVPAKKTDEPTPADESESENIQGELQLGKTDSVILYFGEESGDYAAYCFMNDSEAGKKILASCKDKEQCEVKGTMDSEVKCKVPGLEADLSASGKILTVSSAKSLGRRK